VIKHNWWAYWRSYWILLKMGMTLFLSNFLAQEMSCKKCWKGLGPLMMKYTKDKGELISKKNWGWNKCISSTRILLWYGWYNIKWCQEDTLQISSKFWMKKYLTIVIKKWKPPFFFPFVFSFHILISIHFLQV
jgi:hypothetical protein